MPLDLDIPGDFSSAAFWLVAAVTHPDADVTIHGVGLNPTRTGLLDVLQAMGADVTIEIDQQDPEPMGTLVARSSELRATNVGGDLIPRLIDEASLFALLAACADGESRLTDATELTAKESNRLQTTALALTALDVGVAEHPEGFVIRGKNHLAGGRVDAAGDHRIAMLAATAGLVADGPITIEGTEATAVSYPGFWDDLESLRA
jgi:3-phosphoshikimate 1-carboxyvinyltransferase